jgi:heme exporter protein CcmD
MREFLDMGSYGVFVWPCFVLAGLVLVWNVAAARRLHTATRERAVRRTAAGEERA